MRALQSVAASSSSSSRRWTSTAGVLVSMSPILGSNGLSTQVHGHITISACGRSRPPQREGNMTDDHAEQRMTIVAWSGELDKVWPQLILATTAAAYGMTV